MKTNNKTLLITGGTGSFGKAVLENYINTDEFSEIRIFSRDEKKQSDMMREHTNDKIKFYIGNVRDRDSVENAVNGVDYIFHAAALKQVPSCEFFPMEAYKTNVIGTENVLESAIKNKVKKVVVLSTDKAVYPINAMGISKAMMEKVVVAKASKVEDTIISCTRYGNVMASRGSVIPLFIEQIKNNKDVTVTDPEMTRFMMTLKDAVNLVMKAFEHAAPGDIFVQKTPGVSINILAETLLKLYRSSSKIKIIGIRHGEKKHESLLTSEERSKAEDLGPYYRVPADNRDLNYDKFFYTGVKQKKTIQPYSSNNTEQLDMQSMEQLLLKEINLS